MINFPAIKQQIIAMDYGRNVQSLIVLVPSLSLVVQRMQINAILRTIENNYLHRPLDVLTSHEFTKITNIYKWHVIGSAIQAIAFALLMRPFPKAAAIPFALALGQLLYATSGYFGTGKINYLDGNPPRLHVER